MIKRHKHNSQPIMRRSARVYLNDLNAGKKHTLVEFLRLCHDSTQYFVDLFWQRQDYSAILADLPTVHRGRDKFVLTTRLAQALAKQAKETIRSQRKVKNRKPRLRNHVVSLYSHFVSINPFGGSFDYAVNLIGSGAPRMVIPVKSTRCINKFIKDGWTMAKTIRLGRDGKRLWIDFIFEKPRPEPKAVGEIVGMDSNYKAGIVLSNGQVVGDFLYPIIQGFSKRQKHTHRQVECLIGQVIKQIDFFTIRVLCIENLKNVKKNKRGKFPRLLNRRLSHWQYSLFSGLLGRHCEEHGILLERKNPAYTSQFCRSCFTWDRRNRVGDKFCCIHCGFTDHADHNAAKNLELLGKAGVYGLRLLQSDGCH